ncbi:hypothetical protein QR680_010447 [Steinernema hermaphroditum]|uniref:Uncharacterized protein n=1 Tax=Steinernema hermaphroditum TaxID=289476 RepID=A0AA39MBT4_9BILA|nr:hypothetical protein QR680_010447 [Steinernema hermaphroditum]
MSALSKLIIYWLTIAFGVFSIAANIRNLIFIFAVNQSNTKQYGMLRLTVIVHLVYNVCSTAYTLNMILIFNLIYLAASLMLSTSLSVVCCDVCTVVDRILAIERPVVYSKRYKTNWLIFATGLVLFAFVGNVIVYECGKNAVPEGDVQHFRRTVSDRTIDIMYWLKSGILLCNVPLTVFFLWRLNRFLKSTHMFVTNESLKKANQLVKFQMLAEIFVIIVPTMVATVIDWGANVAITTVVGSYPTLTYVLYTSFCAVSLAIRLRNSTADSTGLTFYISFLRIRKATRSSAEAIAQ